ncbi:MAG: BamA/TamA family outer membrane protein [Oligoflexia bacterium]|nr:BamA/TamA family outer membrane protein [Oligoflexia bacterium]
MRARLGIVNPLFPLPGERRLARRVLLCTSLFTSFLTGLAWAALGNTARAEPAEADAYQRELAIEALTERSLLAEPAPEGKRIESILILSREVIDHRDPWPLFLNALHRTTRDEVISRELLFREGEPWRAETIAETERNLRKALFTAVARVIPAQGSTPEQVRAVVLTKDLWSLRTNYDFSYVGSTLEQLTVELEERNVAGTMRGIAADFQMDLASWSVGQRYTDPYFAGSRLQIEQKASLIFSRQGGRNEGALGSLVVQSPLRSLEAEWGWNVSAAFRRDTFRLFSRGALAEVTLPGTGEDFPYLFERRRVEASARVTRSFGRELKQNLSLGWLAYLREYTVPDPGAALSQASHQEFRGNYVPRNENAGLLAFTYEAYVPDYRDFIEIESFAITEDIRLGPSLKAEARFANPLFGFDSSYLEPAAELKWAWSWGDNLLQSGFAAQARYQPGLEKVTSWVNRLASLEIKNAFPRWGFLRLHAHAALTRRWEDLDRQVETLGGDDALRGYPSAYRSGSQLVSGNLELRSKSFHLKSVHLGGAAFYDVGDAFNDSASLLHSVGMGLRIVFPEFNRSALRLDFGFPLQTIRGGTPSYFVAKFGQAF